MRKPGIRGEKTIMSITALTLTALYATTPLLIHSGFPENGGWDLSHHVNWANQISIGIKEGVFYPRWLSGSNGGYGSPTPIFYSLLFHWLVGIVNLFISSLTVSLKIVTFAGFLLSGVAMYLFLRNFCGRVASIAGGISYQLLPYHVFDLYVRETLGETFAFLWFPLILHFAYKGVTKDTLSNWIGMAFSYAGLILTHIASAYMFTFIIAAFAIVVYISGGSVKVLPRLILAALFGLCLSAVYFIPMFFEREFVHIEWLSEGEASFADYRRNFLFLPGGYLNSFHTHLEKIFALQALLVISSLIYLLRRGRKELPNIFYIAFLYGFFVFSLFLSTPVSLPIWTLIPGLPTIQFPWRWLMVSTFAAAALVGFMFDTFSFKNIKRDRVMRVSLALFHAFLIGNLYLASIYIMTAEPMQKKVLEGILRNGGDVIEYRPIWLADKKKDFSRGKWIPVQFVEGRGAVDVISWNSQSRLFMANALMPSTLRVSTFYYPGWTALIDGREIPIGIEKDSGAMLLNIPPGKNEVLLEFRDTPLRRTAKWVSILSLFAALFGLVIGRLQRQ